MKSFLYFLIIISLSFLSFWYIDLKSKEVQKEIDKMSTRSNYFNADKIEKTVDLVNPKKNEIVESPIKINGKVSGRWYFEGVIKAKIVDSAGTVLGQGPLIAEGDWMVEKNVPFNGIIPFINSKSKDGFLIIEAVDPSGLGLIKPYRQPILFKDVVAECEGGDCEDVGMCGMGDIAKNGVCVHDSGMKNL
jgi:Immunoglobulin-like domain of bacterial spore germination